MTKRSDISITAKSTNHPFSEIAGCFEFSGYVEVPGATAFPGYLAVQPPSVKRTRQL